MPVFQVQPCGVFRKKKELNAALMLHVIFSCSFSTLPSNNTPTVGQESGKRGLDTGLDGVRVRNDMHSP